MTTLMFGRQWIFWIFPQCFVVRTLNRCSMSRSVFPCVFGKTHLFKRVSALIEWSLGNSNTDIVHSSVKAEACTLFFNPSVCISAMCLIAVSVLKNLNIQFILCVIWLDISFIGFAFIMKQQMYDTSLRRIYIQSHLRLKLCVHNLKRGTPKPIQVAFLQSFLLNPNTSRF